jgi:hypothetical protein
MGSIRTPETSGTAGAIPPRSVPDGPRSGPRPRHRWPAPPVAVGELCRLEPSQATPEVSPYPRLSPLGQDPRHVAAIRAARSSRHSRQDRHRRHELAPIAQVTTPWPEPPRRRALASVPPRPCEIGPCRAPSAREREGPRCRPRPAFDWRRCLAAVRRGRRGREGTEY